MRGKYISICVYTYIVLYDFWVFRAGVAQSLSLSLVVGVGGSCDVGGVFLVVVLGEGRAISLSVVGGVGGS